MKFPKVTFDKKLWGNVVLFFAVSCVILSYAYLFMNGDPRRDDEYFHFKLAYNMRTEGWHVVQCFDPIYLNKSDDTCGRYEVNLYNLSLIPFTYISDHVFALKVMNVFFAAMAFTLIYALMKKNNVRHAFLLTLLLMTFSSFVLRTLHGRAYVLIGAFMLWEMYFGIEKKYKSLFVMTFIHILWHQATFFLPMIVIGIVEVVRYITSQKIDFKNIAIVVGAFVCGKAFYPGFPGSIFKAVKEIFVIQQSTSVATASIAGSELEAKNFMDYFTTKTFLLIMIVINACVAMFVFFSHRMQALEKHGVSQRSVHWILSLFVLMIFVTGGNFLISGRFDDFLVPVIGLLFAHIVTLLFDGKFFSVDKYLQTYLMAGVTIALSVMLAQSITLVRNTAEANKYPAARHAAQWIQERSEPGEKVFLHNWTDFTLMYFYNSDNRYSMGIEPTALKRRDELLYWKYYNILINTFYCDQPRDCATEVAQYKKSLAMLPTSEKNALEKENSRKIIESIKNDFGAKYIVSNSGALDQVLLLNSDLIADKWLNDGSEGGMHHSAFELK